MEQLTLDLVKAAVIRLSCHYPNSGIAESALQTIIEDWHMDFNCAHISPVLFSRMVVLARRRCKFFPTEADMLDCMKEIKAMDGQKSTIISFPEPDFMSDEESEIGLRRLRKAIELVSSGKSPDEAEREMAEYIASGSAETV